MAGRKLVVLMGVRTANRLAANIASQQHPQQLQMKDTRSRTFSPNCTRLRIAGLSEQIVTFCLIQAASDAVFNQRARSGVEGHTDVHRRFAIAPQMRRLVAAIAGADADVRRRLDDSRGSFVVKHV